jgi:hypothetical protein
MWHWLLWRATFSAWEPFYASKNNKRQIDDEAHIKKQPKDRVEGGKSPKRGKDTSKIRLEWLICIIESGQKKKRTHLHRKTAGIMISEPAEL